MPSELREHGRARPRGGGTAAEVQTGTGAEVASMADRMVSNQLTDDERGIEAALRPQTLQDYVGQSRMKESLRICIQAARRRGEALDHAII